MNIFKKIVSRFKKKEKPYPYKVDLTKVKASQIDISVEELIRMRFPEDLWEESRTAACECIRLGIALNSHEIQYMAWVLSSEMEVKNFNIPPHLYYLRRKADYEERKAKEKQIEEFEKV